MSSPVHNLYPQLELELGTQIRLTKLQREVTEGILILQLRSFTVQNARDLGFIALSYTWGPSTNREASDGFTDRPIHEIVCNNRPLMITENLYAFLLNAAACPAISSRWLWIDAICINQQNKQERTSQVKMMPQIYSSAFTVMVWLGKDDASTADAFRLLHALSKCGDKDWEKLSPKSLKDTQDGVEEEGEIQTLHNLRLWNALVKLFQRRYFSRIWIIQEVTLAIQRVAVCGRYTIPWDDIVQVSKYLTITSWTRWISAQFSLGDHGAATNLHHTNPNFIEANRRTARSGESRVMLYSLIRGRRFQASEPRDKIYALLGVAGSAVAGKPRFEPVYDQRSVRDAYLHTAIQILEDSNDLLLLAHAEGDKFRTYHDLPTWVPDWSVARAVGLGVTGYARFCASRDIPRHLEINESKCSLLVKGVKLDTIVFTAESKEQVLNDQPFPRLLQLLNDMPETYSCRNNMLCEGQPPGEVLWRCLITDTGGVQRVHPAPANFGNAGLQWLETKLSMVEDQMDHALTSKARRRLERSIMTPVSDVSLDADEYEATFSYAQHLRPFATSQSFIGIGSESCQEGDVIFIIAGSRIPLILRQQRTADFRLVGGAYVHGFMTGEALTSSEDFDILKIV